MSPRPELGVVTPVGRNEPRYLALLAESITATAEHLHTHIEWSLALDSNAPTMQSVNAITRELPTIVRPHVTEAPTAELTGPGSARNRALANVTAPWLLTIDSDDTLQPEGVRALLDAVTSAPDLAWAAGRAYDIDPDGVLINTGPDDVYTPGRVPQGQFYPWRAATGNPPFHPSATIARTDTVKRVGGWPEGWTRTEDSALWSVLDAWFPGIWIPELVLNYRKHPNSITGNAAYTGTAPELMPLIAGFIHAGSTNPAQP